MVSPPSKWSEVSSQSTLPFFRAMKPSRLAAMWIVTRDFVSSIVTPHAERNDLLPTGGPQAAVREAVREIDRQPEHEPDAEAFPRVARQPEHHVDARGRSGDRHQRQRGDPERARP